MSMHKLLNVFRYFCKVFCLWSYSFDKNAHFPIKFLQNDFFLYTTFQNRVLIILSENFVNFVNFLNEIIKLL